MKCLSIYNEKGGVGKTTVCINVAAGLALMLSREAGGPGSSAGSVLVVDLDTQAHSEITLAGGFFGRRLQTGLGPYDNIPGLLMMQTDLPVREIIRAADIPRHGHGNLHYLPSSKDKMPQVEAALIADPVDGLFQLRDLLGSVEESYEYVLVDNPPSRSHLSMNSLVAATHVVVPLELEAPAIEGLGNALKTIKGVQRQHNHDLQLLGILPNKVNFHITEQREFYDALCREYGDLILPPISRRAEVTQATSEGLDIFSYRPPRSSGGIVSASPATAEFARATEEIRRRMDT
jgi:chromosome partitioning protein